MTDLEYEKKFKAGPLMCDYNLRLYPAEVFRALQTTADEHVDRLGYGGYAMADRGYSWVLIRSELQIDEYPVYNSHFSVYTATSETRHGVYPRYFEIRSEEGRVLGKGLTLWVVLDNEKRVMVSEKESGICVDAAFKRNEVPPIPANPKPLQDGTAVVSKRTVKYCDMDMVGHMNNTHYIDWLSDAFDWQRYKTRAFSHILISYAEEVRPDTELTLELRENGDEFSFRDLSEGSSHFVIRGTFKKI